jgi:transcription elongation factor Elf1
MPDSEANSTAFAATALPDCPLCGTRLVVQRIIPGRLGLEHWTLRCTKCGHIHQDAIDTSSPPHNRSGAPTLWPDS